MNWSFYLHKTPRSRKKRILKKFKKLQVIARIEYDLFLERMQLHLRDYLSDLDLQKLVYHENPLLKNLPKSDDFKGADITIPMVYR